VLRRAFLVGLVTSSIGLAACSREHGPPRPQGMPHLDKVPALRGGGAARSPRIANYKIDAKLDAQTHAVTGTETLTWTNTGQSQVDSLPFHLYMNAFKNEDSLFMRTTRGEMRGAHASDGAWGWIQVDSLQIGGLEMASQLKYRHQQANSIDAPDDQTVADLPLAQPVQPGQTIEINIKFTTQLPEVFARTGYKGDFNMVGQWFPKIGVRVGAPGAEHWECQALSAYTEFFADFGVYDVALTVPNTYVVAATGVLVAATESPGGTRTLTYHAEDVHDFVWMADPYMITKSGKATLEDGSTVIVRVVYRPEQESFAARHLQAAIGAIEKFSADFVPYPWSIMTVVDPPLDAASGAGGMEYPTLVTTELDSVFARPGMHLPEFVTVHEVGHNWFQGMLASNEPVEAWMDEGINEWADSHVMADLYGARTSAIDSFGFTADYLSLSAALTEDPAKLPSPIATAAFAFPDASSYSEATYTGTNRALTTLERLVGTSKFMAAMKTYAKTWAFKHPTGRDLFAVLEKELGQNLDWYIGPVFEQVGGMHLAVRSSHCRPMHGARGVMGDGAPKKTVTETDAADTGAWQCDVIVDNTGVIHIPIDVELEFADGSTQRVPWEDRGQLAWERISVEHSTPLVAVKIDPDNKIALDVPVEHQYLLEGDGAASLRAGARMASWARVLMQLVGP
jgi:Peptidase family M1 domain